MKTVARLCLLIGFLAGILYLLQGPMGCNRTPNISRAEQINQLSLYMQQRYRRELDKDRFSINYIPKPPDNIILTIEYYPNADRQLISTLVESAKDIIRQVSAERFHLDGVEIKVEMKGVEPPKADS